MKENFKENYMRYLKTTLIVLGTLVVIYIGFVTVDCLRLKNSKISTKPVITISKELAENKITYYGLGYYVQYYIDIVETENNGTILKEARGYGAEFRLFNKILIWAWAE